jgi:hypothetical protein
MMNPTALRLAVVLFAAPAMLAAQARSAPTRSQAKTVSTPDWSAVDQAFGRPGVANPGDVMRYGFPRSDLAVYAPGVQLRPAFALGGWTAFKMTGPKTAMMMGDLVLTEDEVTPVMRALQEGGIEQTALHNHGLNESPRIFYMHIAGHGDPVTIATAVKAALGKSRTPLGTPAPAGPPAPIDLDTAAIFRALGASGRVNGGVLQFTLGRSEPVRENGHDVAPSMGVGTVINFQPTGDGNAAATGDFALLATELNPVIRTMQEHGIAVTAIHSHMTDETPRLTMMHFWAQGNATELARALGAALDKTKTKRAPVR